MSEELKRFKLEWQSGFHKDANGSPEKWYKASVPGAVQLDWMEGEKLAPYWLGDNFKEYLWTEDVFWTYRARVRIPEKRDGQRVFFICKGVDYRFKVLLDDSCVLDQEGMFSGFELELEKDIEIRILIYPVPKSVAAPQDRAQANASCKPAVSYGWDFHPRLIPSGIWDETYIELREKSFLRDAELSYELSEDYKSAFLSLQSEIENPAGTLVRWRIFDQENQEIFNRTFQVRTPEETFCSELKSPLLWWPSGWGKPTLYRSETELLDADGKLLDRKSQNFGLRKIRLIMNPGAWDKPEKFPKTRSAVPATVEINGIPIFAKGVNWVSPDIFYGTTDRARYAELLTIIKDCHMNIVRCWGGAPVPKDSFFDICDEEGLLVWQEFPLSCNKYSDSDSYLKILDQESRSIIKRLRRHPALMMWCGGNELFNSWSGMTDQSLAPRLLNRNCYELDRGRPFQATSPLSGTAHGHYVFRDMTNGEEVWKIFQDSAYNAYTEFGCPAPASLEVLKTFIAGKDLFPPARGTVWESHHGFGSWTESHHLCLDAVEHYFGKASSLEELIENAQFLQAEGLRGVFEEVRRQKPYASMAISWCYNEPWPAAANLSVVSWPCVPKKAVAYLKSACRPFLASARIKKIEWTKDEIFDPELWILSDSPERSEAGRLEVFIEADSTQIKLGDWDYPELEANCNMKGPRMEIKLHGFCGRKFKLVLKNIDNPSMDSVYELLLK